MQITGNSVTREVTVDGVVISPEKSQRVREHSPDGFAWGYGGSGPAQLALAILLEFTERTEALDLYQTFKWEHVAKWNGDFAVTLDVPQWLSDNRRHQ